MNGKKVPGLRIFLFTIIDMISRGVTEKCNTIEELLADGVASKLYDSYNSFFEQNGFDAENISEIDEYYRQMVGVVDGQEMRKYSCSELEGLQLIVKLTLNEIA